MDNFLLQIIVKELGLRLGGHRVGGIYQIGATDLAIDFYAPNERWLMISTDPQRLAFYLTARNPKQSGDETRSDTAFVALARKYLGGSRLAAAEKLGYDRVLHLEFNVKDKDGKNTRRKLVAALTGRSANILLVEDSRIIASLREHDETITQYVDPAPPADKLDPFLCSAEKLDEQIAAAGGDLAEAARRLIGFSPVYARELAARAGLASPYEALRGLLGDLYEASPKPSIYSPPTPSAVPPASMDDLKRELGREDFDLVLSPIELESLSDRSALRFSGVVEAVDAYFALVEERRRFFALKRKLRSHILSRLRQRRDLLNHLARDLDKFSNGEVHQRYGELLLSNLRQAVKTGGGFQVTDYYDESQPLIEIPSAGIPTPQEAAEHYFKLARKARRGFEKVGDRLPQVENEIAQLEKHLVELEACVDAGALNNLAAQLNLPAPEKKPSQSAKKEVKIPGVRRYRSSDGYEIMVGRAGADNDNLTFRVAKSYDLWFHAADYPGSHVVLRNPQRKPVPPRSIAEAAQLAAKFSQARTLPRAAVNYCERKYVTKMKGFAPGQVRLSSFKTLMVEPAEAGERLD
ncbi:MAG TPA: NFACT family protein [Blastocatellia bacterium]|nr:NFACT family protein [Blastocatellia bacterium]